MYLSDDPQAPVYAQQVITITCPIHGQFLETAFRHIAGHGCPVCDYENPEHLDDLLEASFAKLMSK